MFSLLFESFSPNEACLGIAFLVSLGFPFSLLYIANYGYTDASGDYYITIDSQKCDGCGKCVDACPEKVFEIITDDYDDLVAKVRDEVVKNLKYICGPCKPVSEARELKCQRSCAEEAISHSW